MIEEQSKARLWSDFVKAKRKLKAAPRDERAKIRGQSKAGREFSYEYMYASLKAVVEVIQHMCDGTDLDYTQEWWIGDQKVWMKTVLVHASGETHSFQDSALPCATSEPKQVGAIVAYLRRYQLQAIWGIPSEDDEDKVPENGYKTVGDSEVLSLKALIDQLGYSEPDVAMDNLCKYFNIGDIKSLRLDAFEHACSVLSANAPNHKSVVYRTSPGDTNSIKPSGTGEPEPPHATLTEGQMGTLRAKAKEKGFTNIAKTMDRLAQKFGVKGLRDVPQEAFAQAMDVLEEGPK